MTENKVWTENCEKAAKFFASCDTVEEAMGITEELERLPIKSYGGESGLYTTKWFSKKLDELIKDLEDDLDEGERVKIGYTSAWKDDYQKYFFVEGGIKKEVAELYYEN